MGDRIWGYDGYDSVGAKRVLTTVRGVTSNVATTTLLFGGTLRVTGNLPVYANVEWKRANAVAPNVVDIKGAGGQTRKNVHFTKQWPGKSWLYTRYDPGTQLGDRVVGRMTVNNVATVDARVLSSKFSTEVHYMYTEVEKTKGITRRIEEVKPLIPFRVRNSALGAGSGKVLDRRASSSIRICWSRASTPATPPRGAQRSR